ncbi:MAG: hypothetical protein ACXVVQ_01580 [Solirubrobacteraceae bacterium]
MDASEPQSECREHQNNPDVHYQPLPEPVPEEQDVYADDNGYQRENVSTTAVCLPIAFFYHPCDAFDTLRARSQPRSPSSSSASR